MSSSHICQACHRSLRLLRPRRLPQWQQRAHYIPLSRNSPRITTDETAKDDILNLGDDVRKREGRYAALPERTLRASPPGKTSPGDILESLFEQSITEAVASENANPRSISSLEPYKKVEALKEMMRQSTPLADSFSFFAEHFGSKTGRHGPGNPRSSSPSYLHSTARNLLKSIIIAKRRDPFSKTLPSVTEISRVYLRLGMLFGADWVDLMAPLIENIIKLTEEPTASGLAREQRLFSDLLGAWNVVCRNAGNFEDLPEDSSSGLNWSHIPSFSSEDVARIHRKAGATVAFGILTPPFAMKDLGRIPSVALCTFLLLSTKSAIAQSLPGDPTRFISALGRIISVPGLHISHADVRGQDGMIAEFIEKRLAIIRDQAPELPNSPQEHTRRSFVRPQLGFNMGLSFINKRLYEALQSKNRHQVDELWSDVSQWPVVREDAKDGDGKPGTLSPRLCNYFILIYMGLKQPNRAINVWNHMVQHGMTPTLATWDSMMSGCKAARDPVALEEVWRKMQLAKVQPDVVCWTTRISGLTACYQLDAAIRALDEMGRKWLDAARKQHPKMALEKLQKVDEIEGAVKPTITTINAAISGALRQKKPEYTQRILAWAGNYGISPDVFTYNTLLRPLLRSGQTQQAMGMLQQMQRAGIEADVATYTTILDETFRYAESLSAEEQKEMVFDIFDEMQHAGLTPNQHTYSKIIYSLLQSSSGDMTVVNLVLERMAKLNLEPSVYIYTTLIEHYFSQEPPELDAARNLIDRASMVIGSADHVFWDRVVEGYSRAGETAAALKVVGKVKSSNSTISWVSLGELLRALARNEEWDMAKALVRDAVIETGGPLSPDERGKEGQHKFWNLANELQLLDR